MCRSTVSRLDQTVFHRVAHQFHAQVAVNGFADLRSSPKSSRFLSVITSQGLPVSTQCEQSRLSSQSELCHGAGIVSSRVSSIQPVCQGMRLSKQPVPAMIRSQVLEGTVEGMSGEIKERLKNWRSLISGQSPQYERQLDTVAAIPGDPDDDRGSDVVRQDRVGEPAAGGCVAHHVAVRKCQATQGRPDVLHAAAEAESVFAAIIACRGEQRPSSATRALTVIVAPARAGWMPTSTPATSARARRLPRISSRFIVRYSCPKHRFWQGDARCVPLPTSSSFSSAHGYTTSYGRIISLSSCSTMWQCHTNRPGVSKWAITLVTSPG